MSRINFNTFKEASEYAKKLAMTLNNNIKLHKDGAIWWVEDPSIEGNKQTVSTETEKFNIALNEDKVVSRDNYKYDEHGYRRDANGRLIKRDGTVIDTSRRASDTFSYRNRTIRNTPTAIYSNTDGQ